MKFLGLDIGGANVKFADGHGWAQIRPFPLWKDPNGLADVLRAGLFEWLAERGTPGGLAVTMTGELCDCFVTKTQGVSAILDAVEVVAGETPVAVYLTDGRFVSPAAAREEPLRVAASNWHALTWFAARFGPDNGLLFDIGSTTSDLIPWRDKVPHATGQIDPERLASRELIYTGIARTPICALVSELPWRGKLCHCAAEWFATTRDVYLILSEQPEDARDTATADGRPATQLFARDRLARCIGADRSLFTAAEAKAAAQHVAESQLRLLQHALVTVLERQPRPLERCVISGGGEFLARRVLHSLNWPGEIISLQEKLGEEVSLCAPAHAVATLAQEQLEQVS